MTCSISLELVARNEMLSTLPNHTIPCLTSVSSAWSLLKQSAHCGVPCQGEVHVQYVAVATFTPSSLATRMLRCNGFEFSMKRTAYMT